MLNLKRNSKLSSLSHLAPPSLYPHTPGAVLFVNKTIVVTIPFPIEVLEAENGMTSSWAAYTSLVVLFTSKPNNNGAKTLQYYYIVYLAAIYKHTQLQLKRIKNEERNFVQQKLILHNYNIATDIGTINIINKKNAAI